MKSSGRPASTNTVLYGSAASAIPSAAPSSATARVSGRGHGRFTWGLADLVRVASALWIGVGALIGGVGCLCVWLPLLQPPLSSLMARLSCLPVRLHALHRALRRLIAALRSLIAWARVLPGVLPLSASVLLVVYLYTVAEGRVSGSLCAGLDAMSVGDLPVRGEQRLQPIVRHRAFRDRAPQCVVRRSMPAE